MAVLMGALTMQGIFPGPELFTTGRFWVNSIMAGLLIINIFMFLQGNFFVRAFAHVTKVPFQVLIPCIMILCSLGAFAVSNSIFDVYIMFAFGIVGYMLKQFDFPLPPLTIALVLGQLTENNLRRSLIMSKGSIGIFFSRPISLMFLIIAAYSLLYPAIRNFIKKRNMNDLK